MSNGSIVSATAVDGGPLITVAVCTHNRAELMAKAVRSVVAQWREGVEILIVDNGSADETPRVAAGLAREYPGVTAIREDRLGLSWARNTSLERARGRFVLFLDDDAVAAPGWLEAYVKFLSNPPEPRVAVAGGAVWPDFETTPPGWLGPGIFRFDLGGAAKRLTSVGGPWGGNSAYDRKVALEAGGFDTNLGRKGKGLGAHEETDLNARLEKAGYSLWWVPDAAILHLIQRQRLTLGWFWRSSYNDGKSAALHRLQDREGRGARLRFAAVRLLVTPFQIFFTLVTALLGLPVNQGQSAAHHFFRAARQAGMAVQLLVEFTKAGRNDPVTGTR